MYGANVRDARCDDAAKHEDFEKAFNKERRGVYFEYTIPDIPQEIGGIERKLATQFQHEHCVLYEKLKVYIIC